MSHTALLDSDIEPGPEHDVQGGLESRADDNYWPMFRSAAQAALLTVLGQFLFAIYIALQRGIAVELRLWNKVVPYLAMVTQQPIFESVVRWASIATCVVLAVFSIGAFVQRKRLQVQAGRAFAWIDIALIGFMSLTRTWWFDDRAQPATWMYGALVIGLVGFAVAFACVAIDAKDREEP